MEKEIKNLIFLLFSLHFEYSSKNLILFYSILLRQERKEKNRSRQSNFIVNKRRADITLNFRVITRRSLQKEKKQKGKKKNRLYLIGITNE